MIEEITTRLINAQDLKEQLLKDNYRAGYHFCVPFDLGFPADPNAMFYAFGRYHMMFIYESRKDACRYGHASSIDLTHWRFHNDALIPDETDGSIYSGGAYLGEDNTAYIAYWSLGKNGKAGGIRLAKSNDFPHYDKWEKQEGYILESEKLGICYAEKSGQRQLIGCADPSNIWKTNNKYYMQLGNLCALNENRDKKVDDSLLGDWTDVLVSNDLKTWDYLHRFYNRENSDIYTSKSEDAMCPFFAALPLENGENSSKFIQIFISHNRGCQYYIGDYDDENIRFEIQKHGRFSYEDNAVFAPECVKTQDGRLVCFCWMRDNVDDDLQRELCKGWSGVYCLPRVLWLDAKSALGIDSPIELNALRYNKQNFSFAKAVGQLELINQYSCELDINCFLHTGEFGIIIYLNGLETEFIKIGVDKTKNQLIFDMTKSKSLGRNICEVAPLDITDTEIIDLKIFIDNGIIDVFANKKQAISRQVFDLQPRQRKICLFGDAKKIEIVAYEMMPSNAF